MPGPGSYWIGEEEKDQVLDVLKSGNLFRYGDLDDPAFRHKVFDYEKELARFCGSRYALATDDILGRSINLSVGVVGAGFGIHIRSTDEEIDRAALTFSRACAG